MPKQTTTYLGGSPQRLTEADVVALARAHTFGLPVGFFVGMALRESGYCTNEIDTDYDEDGNPRPNKTYGLLMINRAEAAGALNLIEAVDPSLLADPAKNLAVGATIFARYKAALELAAGTRGDSPYTDDEMAAYVAIAHNIGIGIPGGSKGMVPSVLRSGIDWADFKSRNPSMSRQASYGDTVIDYVRKYPELGNGSDTWWVKLALLVAVIVIAAQPSGPDKALARIVGAIT